MRDRGILILLIVLIALPLRGQKISHQVLAPASTVASAGGYSISQTVGESAIKLIRSDSYILTQGFQQPSVIQFTPTEPTGSGVKVYPNPVRNCLNLELFGDNSLEYHVTIFGFNGAIYFKKDYSCTGNFRHVVPIDVSTYQRGTYFVKVETGNGIISRLFKIEKM